MTETRVTRIAIDPAKLVGYLSRRPSPTKLLTVDLRRKLPPLYANEGLDDPELAVAYVKFFSIVSDHRWYICEFDGEDLFYGFVTGAAYDEWGYSSLTEFKSLGANVERDLYFTPTTIKEVRRA